MYAFSCQLLLSLYHLVALRIKLVSVDVYLDDVNVRIIAVFWEDNSLAAKNDGCLREVRKEVI